VVGLFFFFFVSLLEERIFQFYFSNTGPSIGTFECQHSLIAALFEDLRVILLELDQLFQLRLLLLLELGHLLGKLGVLVCGLAPLLCLLVGFFELHQEQLIANLDAP